MPASIESSSSSSSMHLSLHNSNNLDLETALPTTKTFVIDEHDTTATTDAVIDFAAGALAGTAAKLIEYPADTVKTRMQSGFYEGKSAFGVCTDIVKKEGAIRGFYSGVAMPVMGCAAECAVAFAVFNYTTNFVLSNNFMKKLLNLEKNRDENSYGVVAMSGAMSGVANGFLLTPVEVVKCRCQANPQKYPNVRQCLKKSAAEEGWKCFGAGFTGTMAREIPGSIGFFIMLECSMRTLFSQYRVSHEEFLLSQQKNQRHHHHQEHHDSYVCPGELKETAPWYVRPICGGCAGFGLVALPFPADTIKTVMQISPESAKMGFLATGKELVKKSGWKILFRGLPITMMRAFPGNAAVFSTYDLVSSYMSKKFSSY